MAIFAATLMLVAALARANCISTTSQALNPKPKKLAEALRSRLKENNYDYMSNEDSYETIPVRREDDTKNFRGVLRRSHLNDEILEHYDADYTAVPELLLESDRLKVRSFYAPQTDNLREALGIEHRRYMDERAHTDEGLSDEYQGDVEYIFSKKDLVQPADEKNSDFLNHWLIDKELVTAYAINNATTEPPKFKVLKVKSPSRRSMNRRRLIQEKSERGVAIVNVDQVPIPLFQLPHSRRQYMYNKDSHSTEESVPAASDSRTTS